MTDHRPADPHVALDEATGGLAIAPSLVVPRTPIARTGADRRTVFVSLLAVGIAIVAGLIAQLLVALIGIITNLAFYGRLSIAFTSPAGTPLGLALILVPVGGALVVGLMARYGSEAIRGHGIPEAMEQVLFNESRIPPRLTLLKPLSAAVAIGTGGPFGAEGPIIATGGAFGSLVGQLLHITADERKILLAAGAAAGMAATFGSPVSAVLLAIELLLFEYRARSLVPVALASAVATAVRIAFVGDAPVFPMPDLIAPGSGALVAYIVLGALVGVASVGVTKVVYIIEDAFDRLPIHWMWWPALGAVVVGVAGFIEPATLGVGYVNIERILGGRLVLGALSTLVVLKFISWSVALGSGTSGGTLAPLFTIGGGLGYLLGVAAAWLLPGAGIDPRIAALVGMAAIFAGASRALLTSVVFAFETTRQPLGLLPLLGGCASAYMISLLLMRHTIMTEKLARRGVRIPDEYAADWLDRILVRDAMTTEVVALPAARALGEVRAWLASRVAGSQHQGYPVVAADGALRGVVTRRDLLDPAVPDAQPVGTLAQRPPAIIFEDHTLRDAADHMVRERVGRLPVVRVEAPERMVGIISRSDLLGAHAERLDAAYRRATPARLTRVATVGSVVPP